MKKIYTTVTAALLLSAMAISGLAGCSNSKETPSSSTALPSAPAGSKDVVSYPLASGVDMREYFEIPTYLQKEGYVGESITVANIVPAESGALQEEKYVVFNGQVLETKNGKFCPEQAGEYQCVFEYVLDELRYRYSYSIHVTVKDGPIFIEQPDLPVAYMEGKTYVIPTLKAFDYAQQKDAQVNVTVSCADQFLPLDTDNSITVPSDWHYTMLTITWKAVSGDKETQIQKKVPVVNAGSGNAIRYAELFAGNGWLVKKTTDEGILFTVSERTQATFINPLISGSTELRFGFGQQDQAESIILTLTAVEDPTVSISMDFQKGRQSEGAGKIILNGTEVKNYTYTKAQTLAVRYSATTNQFLDGDGNLLFAPTIDVNGRPFDGFPGGLVYASWTVENTYGMCDLRIEKVGSQVFNTNTKDLMAPAVYTNSFGSIYKFGDTVTVTNIRAVDIVDPNAQMQVFAFYQNGSEMVPVEGVSFVNNTLSFTPDKPGNYMLRFQSSDASGNTSSLTRLICILDETAPVIKIDGELKQTAKQNEKITLPAATATDNETVTMQIHVIFPSGQMRMLQSGEKLESMSYTVTEVGTYTFRVAAIDASGNCTLQDMPVTVSAQNAGK